MKKKYADALAELERNHQHSLIEEIRQRNAENMDFTALFYRGTRISYRQFFAEVDACANALYRLGYRKGDEIPVISCPIPEFVYIFFAAGRIGAVINIVPVKTSEKFMVDAFNGSKSRYIFVSSNFYKQAEAAVLKSDIQEVFLMRMSDSLTEAYGQYAEADRRCMDFFEEPEISSGMIVHSMDEFISPADRTAPLFDISVTLDDHFSITYSSGTTEKEEGPKGMLHDVRSYMVLLRFMDNDLSGYGTYRHIVGLVHSPTSLHTTLTTSLLNPLFQQSTVALDPCPGTDFFMNALKINRPNYTYHGTLFWMKFIRELDKSENKDVKFPELMLTVVAGEDLSLGEEYYFNRVAKEHQFGSAVLPFPIRYSRFSVGGGTTEASGILITLFRGLQALHPYYLLTGKKVGLTPMGFCRIRILDIKTGEELPVGAVGRVQLSSPCTMLCYTNRKELNEQVMKRDSDGTVWIETGDYGSVDRLGKVSMRGRLIDHVNLKDGSEYPLFYIREAVEKLYRTILSTVIVESKGTIIVHYVPQPFTKKSADEIQRMVRKAIYKVLPEELREKTYLRHRDISEPFPENSSGKTDRNRLIEEGIKAAVRL